MILGLPLIGQGAAEGHDTPKRKPMAETGIASATPQSRTVLDGKNLQPDVQSCKGSSDADNEQMIERARKAAAQESKRGLAATPLRPSPSTAQRYQSHQAHRRHRAGSGCRSYDLRRWFSSGRYRNDAGVAEEVLAFIDAAGAMTIVMTDRIIGLSARRRHRFTKGPPVRRARSGGRDRWTGKRLH